MAAQPENATAARGRIAEQARPAQNVAAARNAGGARLVIGGDCRSGLDEGWFFDPTIFDVTDQSCAIAHEEVFGPGLTIFPFPRRASGVRPANSFNYDLAATSACASLASLAASLPTRGLARADCLTREFALPRRVSGDVECTSGARILSVTRASRARRLRHFDPRASRSRFEGTVELHP
jgi:Aldehyde dehydrogenase family